MADEPDIFEPDDYYDYPPPPPLSAPRREQLEWVAKVSTSSNPPWDRELYLAIEEIEHRYPFSEG